MATLTSVITGGPRAGCPPFSLNSRPEDHSVSLISYSSNAWVRSRPRALEMATVRSVTTRCPRNLVVRAEAATNLLSGVGLSYGRRATTLSPPDDVLHMYQDKYGISKMSLSPTDNDVISILNGIIQKPVKMQVDLWIDYSDLNELGNEESAKEWIGKYITPYEKVIRYICVGNVIGSLHFQFPLFRDAMRNLKQLIPASSPIKLSAIADVSKLLQPEYDAETHPSSCRLTTKARKVVRLLSKLNGSPSPLFVQIMPYFMMTDDDLALDNFLLEESAKAYMWDDNYCYRHAFDAMLDSICCALTQESDELGKVDIHVLSGWPTKGPGPNASPSNAETYINNLVSHVTVATPRYNKPADVFIYSLVDENTLQTDTEEFKHLGVISFLRRP